MTASSTKLSREELYKQVWETPIHRLSVKYGLSDVGLAKACKRMDIPRPPRGYWRRRQTGAKVHRTPLPKADEDTQLEITFRQAREVPVKRAVKHEPRTPARMPVVDEALVDPHPLVATAKERLAAAAEDKCGIVATKLKRILPILVSRDAIDRCLRLMDTLIKSWEAEGLVVKFVKEDGTSPMATFLCDGDERLRISIEEGIEEYDPGPGEDEKLRPKWEWSKRTASRATGQVTFRLEGDHVSPIRRFKRQYQDREGLPVEQKAKQIWSAGMDYFDQRKQHAIAEEQRRVAAEHSQRQWEEQQRRWNEQWERQQEEQRREEAEKRKIEELAAAAESWERAKRVRTFIPACEKRMRDKGVGEDVIATWKDWASAAADSIDPLKRGYPSGI